MHPLTEDHITSICTIAGLKVERIWQLVHSYFSFQVGEDEETTQKEALYRAMRPSFLVKTPHGLIQFNLRKRVVEIDWKDTGYDALDVGAGHPITKDDVTKDHHYVHAYDLVKAAEYLTALREQLMAPHEAADVICPFCGKAPKPCRYDSFMRTCTTPDCPVQGRSFDLIKWPKVSAPVKA